MFCTNCGKENKDTDLFCKYCGTPLKKPQLTNQSTTSEQQVAPKPTPEQQPDFEPAQQPASEPTQQAASTQQPIPTPEATTPLQPAMPSSTVADETQPQTQIQPQHQKHPRTKKPMRTGTKIAILAIVAILAGFLIGGTAFAIAQGYIQLPWEKHEEAPAEQPEETPAEDAEESKDTQEPAEKDDKNSEPTIPDQTANLKIGQFYKNYLGNFNADWLLASTTDGVKSKGIAQYALGDVNGDGITDYVLDDSELQCYGASGSVGMFGNRNGGGVTVFLGRADGKAEKVFYYSAFGAKIDYVGKQAKLYLGMAGTYCGQTPESEKRDGYEKCSRPLKWNDKSRRFQIDMQTKRTALHWW